eukprot:gene6558-3212_t
MAPASDYGHEVADAALAGTLLLQISKCTFAQPKTVFLGFQVSSDGLSVDPKKIAVVADWSLPHDSQSTRSFLGFTGFYRRFIKDYAKIAAPLTELTKTSKPFPHPLPQPAVDAFHILKAALIQAPLLVIPFTGTTATFELYTDASGLGVGAVLLQDQGKGPQPLAYESRKYKPAEKDYAVHEHELLAVVHGVKKFRHYLEGCKHFHLYTDHHSLKYFFTQRDLSKRQARWSQDLAPFQPNMTIVYKLGPENQADALSRLFLAEIVDLLPHQVIISDPIQHDIALGYSDNPLYAQPENPKRPSFLEKHNDLWYFKGRLCVPNIPELRLRILHEYHVVPSAGHPGFHKTLNAVADKFWWPPSPAALIVTSDVSSEAADYMSHLKDVQASVTRKLEFSKAQQAEYADRRRRPLQFSVGDQARLSSDFISLYDQPSANLRHWFLGPFTVLECIPTTDPTAYKLDLPSSMSRVHPVFHVSRLLPWTPNNEDEFPGRHIPNQPIPAAKDYVYSDAYEVDRILDVKIAQDPASRARSSQGRQYLLSDAMKVFLRSPEYHTFTLTPAFLSFACKHKAKIPKVVRFDIP